jgi:ferredoxin
MRRPAHLRHLPRLRARAVRLEVAAGRRDELGMLEFTASPRQANSRLSCQIDLTAALDGLAVDLPPRQT